MSFRDCFDYFTNNIRPTVGKTTEPKVEAIFFDLDQTPNVLARADLPCFIYVFDPKLKAGTEKPSAYVKGEGVMALRFEHQCFVQSVGQGLGLMQWQPRTIQLLDQYSLAITYQPDLNGRLAKAMEIKNTRLGKLVWNDLTYFGFAVELEWTRYL